MFGDTKYVVDSAIQPNTKLHKSHTDVSFHQVRDTIAYNMVAFYRVYGGYNPADILSKNWSYTHIWGLLQPLLFCMGYTMEFLDLELNRDGGQEKGE